MEIVAILSDRKKTAMMCVAEPCKVIGTFQRFDVALKEGCTVAKAVADMKIILEKTMLDFDIVAIFATHYDEGFYKNTEIKMISNGTQFIMLDDMIKGIRS